MSLSGDLKLMSHDKNIDLTGVALCRVTLFACLRQDHLSVRQVPMMLRHKADLLLF